MTEFLQQLLNGISLGAIFALIALGYTMVYGVLRFINFAHSDVFMVGAFVGTKTVLAAALCTLLAGGMLSVVFMFGHGVANVVGVVVVRARQQHLLLRVREAVVVAIAGRREHARVARVRWIGIDVVARAVRVLVAEFTEAKRQTAQRQQTIEELHALAAAAPLPAVTPRFACSKRTPGVAPNHDPTRKVSCTYAA